MCSCELDFHVVLVEAEITILPAAEFWMSVHVIDCQLLADAGVVSDFLGRIPDIASLLLLAEEVPVSSAQVFELGYHLSAMTTAIFAQ